MPEMMLLLNFACSKECPRNRSKPFENPSSLADRAETLLKKLHQEILKPTIEALGDSIRHPSSNKNLENALLNNASLREMTLYAEESAYPQQFLPFAEHRYASDSPWMTAHLGFSCGQMCTIIRAIDDQIEENVNMGYPEREHDPCAADFLVSPIQIARRSGLPIEVANAVINFFTCPRTRLGKIKKFGDFNPLVAQPIIASRNRRYLFLSGALSQATYQSPAYAIRAKDSSYTNGGASIHRGKFTEEFVYERLLSILGKHRVFKNVNLWRGKNRTNEIDVLCVMQDHALVIQCKSKGMTMQARQGDESTARKDFEFAVNNAYKQSVGCSNDLLDPQIRLTDEDGNPLVLDRGFSQINPICIVAEHYPSLSIQAQYFLKEDAANRKITSPLISDVFFIDTLATVLQSPLLLFDFVERRCKYGLKMLSNGEIDTLGCYLEGGMDVGKNSDRIFVESDFAIKIDAIMTARYEHSPSGTSRAELLGGPVFTTIIDSLKDPRTPRECAAAKILLGFDREQREKFDEIVSTLRIDSRRESRTAAAFPKMSVGPSIIPIVVPPESSEKSIKGFITRARADAQSHLVTGYCLVIERETLQVKCVAVTQDLTASTHIDLSEKIGRNKPCPCGSGKKYKMCHGKNI